MPFDSNGNFSLAPGYLGVTGQTILTSQHNPPLIDIAAGLSVTLLRTGVAPMLANLPMGGFKMTGLAAGVAATDAANKGQVDATATPVGSVIDYAGSTAPAGWILCYGQAVSRTTYAALFAAIGTAFGVGDGSTTFLLPDCRGRVAAGKDDMGGSSANRLTGLTGGIDGDVLGGVGGAETHILTVAQLAAHGHTATSITTLTNAGAVQSNTAGGNNLDLGSPPGYPIINTVAITAATATTVNSNGSGAAHNNVQPSIIFNKIIRSGI